VIIISPLLYAEVLLKENINIQEEANKDAMINRDIRQIGEEINEINKRWKWSIFK